MLGEFGFAGAEVSACVIDLGTGERVLSVDDHVSLPTASVGKVLLLVELAARLRARPELEREIVDRTPLDDVADSGLWQHLEAPAFPLSDLGALVGGVSDNLATNVLLRHLGLRAVRERAESLGLERTALLDLVRDERGPDDAPQLSVGSAAELAWLFGELARGRIVDEEVSRRVLGWLALGSDLSMVASAFGLDPLAHRAKDHGIQVINKTGTDVGVRSEVGVLFGPRTSASYAVTLRFEDTSLQVRLRALETMRAMGTDVLEYVH